MSNPVTHKVVSGDTLFSLGKKYGLTVAELKSINNLTSDTIKVGQVLKLTPFTHTVVSGDTLFSLAKKHNTTVDTLKSLNGLKSDTIKVGQILRLPEIFSKQLQLNFADTDMVFRNVAYELKLADGSIYSGVTNEQGFTQSINYSQENEPDVISIDVPAINLSCCYSNQMVAGLGSVKFGEALKKVSYVSPVVYTAVDSVKRSVAILSLFHEGRKLKQGEIDKLNPIFGNGINYDKVRITDKAIISLINSGTATAPMGIVHFPKEHYVEDFSQTGDWHWFVHEMTHVWQYQLKHDLVTDAVYIAANGGYTLLQGATRPRAYLYTHLLSSKNKLSDFNMEQQADIIADYYVNKSTVGNESVEKILADFKKNPKDDNLLPNTTNF